MAPTTPQPYPTLRHPADAETTLYLVRHGRTVGNARAVFQGVTDGPLDAFGLRQAQLLADRLRGEIAADALVTSPLTRAVTTAQIIGAQIGLVPTVVPGLREVDFGELEGATFDRLLGEYPELAVRLMGADVADAAWPGGESVQSFYHRVQQTFAAILSEHAGRTVIAVAHGGVIGAFLAFVQGLPPNRAEAYEMLNCSLTHLVVTPSHTVIHCYNDVTHLDGLVDDQPHMEGGA